MLPDQVQKCVLSNETAGILSENPGHDLRHGWCINNPILLSLPYLEEQPFLYIYTVDIGGYWVILQKVFNSNSSGRIVSHE